jgi:hypothetical protein
MPILGKHLITSAIPSKPLSAKGFSYMRCLRNTSHTPPDHNWFVDLGCQFSVLRLYYVDGVIIKKNRLGIIFLPNIRRCHHQLDEGDLFLVVS